MLDGMDERKRRVSLLMIVPVIVMAIVLERYISRGILAGAVKG
jgi:ABC-type glycerol-3-phosphate transport system permease component